MTSSPAAPRPASTVVVIRPSPDGLEVLLVRRNDKVAFMAGAYVFPGGRVDDEDRAIAPSRVDRASRFVDLTPEQDFAFRIAAVRELREEAAINVGPEDLLPIAHWVTPEIEIRRYDTRFFLALLPDGQTAQHDAGETTEFVWVAPARAIERCSRGEIMLPPPTWTTLKRLARHANVDEALRWARSTPIVTVQPGFIRDERQTLLTLPGDPLHPTITGWEVPEDTRFLLEEGRGWRPVPA